MLHTTLGSLKSARKPSDIIRETPYVFRSPSPHSSPPILQPSIPHPPRSQCRTPEEPRQTVPSAAAAVPACPRHRTPHKRTDIPCPCPCDRCGMEGSGYRASSIHSASRPSAQAPHLTGDHNIYQARKLKLKGTWAISFSTSRVIGAEDLKMYHLLCMLRVFSAGRVL